MSNLDIMKAEYIVSKIVSDFYCKYCTWIMCQHLARIMNGLLDTWKAKVEILNRPSTWVKKWPVYRYGFMLLKTIFSMQTKTEYFQLKLKAHGAFLIQEYQIYIGQYVLTLKKYSKCIKISKTVVSVSLTFIIITYKMVLICFICVTVKKIMVFSHYYD